MQEREIKPTGKTAIEIFPIEKKPPTEVFPDNKELPEDSSVPVTIQYQRGRRRLIHFAGRMIRLTPKEYDLFKALKDGMGEIVLHNELCRRLGGEGSIATRGTLKFHIMSLRKEIGYENILSINGLGYKLNIIHGKPDKTKEEETRQKPEDLNLKNTEPGGKDAVRAIGLLETISRELERSGFLGAAKDLTRLVEKWYASDIDPKFPKGVLGLIDQTKKEKVLKFNGLTYYPDEYYAKIKINGIEKNVTFTSIQNEILKILALSPGKVIPFSMFRYIWGNEDMEANDLLLKKHIMYIRRKIEPESRETSGDFHYIHSVRGVGYRFTPPFSAT